jgi:SAM-dependent methyltransferase
MHDLYNYPRYYDMAFSFRDIRREVDVFEQCFHRHSKIRIRRVLEMACGPSPHLEELARRGYEYVGLDVNPAMIAYARRKAEALGCHATFLLADMRAFSLAEPVDFAFTLLGSLYVENTPDILSHLASVARALNSGGLYLLDWCVNFRWYEGIKGGQSWTIEREGIRIAVKFATEDLMDSAAQICRNRIVADVDDHGKPSQLETTETVRVIFPQEFLLLTEKSREFEFIGWWNNWDLAEPLGGAWAIERPIALIRRL